MKPQHVSTNVLITSHFKYRLNGSTITEIQCLDPKDGVIIKSLVDARCEYGNLPIGASTAKVEVARDLTIDAAQSAGFARNVNSRSGSTIPPISQIKKLLDSRNDREILEGLRKVISVRGNAILYPPSSDSFVAR